MRLTWLVWGALLGGWMLLPSCTALLGDDFEIGAGTTSGATTGTTTTGTGSQTGGGGGGGGTSSGSPNGGAGGGSDPLALQCTLDTDSLAEIAVPGDTIRDGPFMENIDGEHVRAAMQRTGTLSADVFVIPTSAGSGSLVATTMPSKKLSQIGRIDDGKMGILHVDDDTTVSEYIQLKLRMYPDSDVDGSTYYLRELSSSGTMNGARNDDIDALFVAAGNGVGPIDTGDIRFVASWDDVDNQGNLGVFGFYSGTAVADIPFTGYQNDRADVTASFMVHVAGTTHVFMGEPPSSRQYSLPDVFSGTQAPRQWPSGQGLALLAIDGNAVVRAAGVDQSALPNVPLYAGQVPAASLATFDLSALSTASSMDVEDLVIGSQAANRWVGPNLVQVGGRATDGTQLSIVVLHETGALRADASFDVHGVGPVPANGEIVAAALVAPNPDRFGSLSDQLYLLWTSRFSGSGNQGLYYGEITCDPGD